MILPRSDNSMSTGIRRIRLMFLRAIENDGKSWWSEESVALFVGSQCRAPEPGRAESRAAPAGC